MPKRIKDFFTGFSKEKDDTPLEDKLNSAYQYNKDDKKKVEGMIVDLQTYQSKKRLLEQKIVENEKWYMSRHWEIIRKKDLTAPDPVSAYLFNSLANKHADIMDNYPSPNVLGREQADEKEAKMLTSVIPCIFENIEYKDTYSDAGWEKLKHGFAIYSTLWESEAENGLGEISINLVDPLNIYWQPGIRKIKQSKRVFVTDLVDEEYIKNEYPEIDVKRLSGNKAITPTQYALDSSIDIEDKILIVDCYYKLKNESGKNILHFAKFIDANNILYMSENDENYKENGYYEHGEMPFEIDILFPEKETPVGFGYIDILKSPQIYTDKLDEIISENAMKAGKVRHFVKDDTVFDLKDVADYTKDYILCSKIPSDENIKSFQTRPLAPYVLNHRQSKIAELKEVSGANDFNRGEGGKGVTAASAIMALQEAGNKLSRDMIDTSYRRQASVTYLVIELIRQFYDEERKFRITGENGANEYIKYNNQGIKEQKIQMPGMIAPQTDPQMLEDQQQEVEQIQGMYRKPVFDIRIEPEKKSPFSQAAHNELAKEMFGAGLFNPELAEQALVCLSMMSFEGKDRIRQMIQDNSVLLQTLQQAKANMDSAARENYKLKAIVQSTTGQDMGVDMQELQNVTNQQPQLPPEGMDLNG